MSQTALIPFCGLGGNFSAMGVKIDQFDVPVCNSFKEKLVNDQLCYTVDPNMFIDKHFAEHAKQFDLMLVIDYNEDRQLYLNEESIEASKFQTSIDENLRKDYFIYLETIGTIVNNYIICI